MSWKLSVNFPIDTSWSETDWYLTSPWMQIGQKYSYGWGSKASQCPFPCQGSCCAFYHVGDLVSSNADNANRKPPSWCFDIKERFVG